MGFLPSALNASAMRHNQARVNGGSDGDSLNSQGSQMPRHPTGDARERIDEIPIVPIHHPAKLFPALLSGTFIRHFLPL